MVLCVVVRFPQVVTGGLVVNHVMVLRDLGGVEEIA
jgi:hypothetical protein